MKITLHLLRPGFCTLVLFIIIHLSDDLLINGLWQAQSYIVPYISGNSKAPGVGTLPMFCIEKPFCACTAQRNPRIAWRLQNRILVSVKIKLQAITSGNDNKTRPYMVIYSTAPWAINNIPAPKAGPWKVRVQVSCIIVCTVSGIVPPSGFHVQCSVRRE